MKSIKLKATASFPGAKSKSATIEVVHIELSKGYWTSDKEGKKPLKKSKLGKTVYFHIETEGIDDGKELKLRLGDYDYSFLFYSLLDFDDHKFPKEEVVKKAIIKDNKATVELVLQESWESVVKDDHSMWFQSNESIELYWEVRYNKLKKLLPKKTNDYLRVAQSDRTLYIKTPTAGHNLPEFIGYDGNPMFLMEFGKGFAINTAKGEMLNAATKEAGTQIKKIALTKLKKGYMVDNAGKLYTGKRLIYEYKEMYNNSGELFENIQKGKNFGYNHGNGLVTTRGISQYDYFSSNGKRVTMLGMVKNIGTVFDIFNLVKSAGEDLDTSKPLPLDLGPLSPLLDLAGAIVQQQKAEDDMFIEEVVQDEIDLAKLQGLEATRKAINSWNHNKEYNWQLIAVSNETANKLLQRGFETMEELEKYDFDYPIKSIEILQRIVFNQNKEIDINIIETIFINE
ncbi:hypothetical protein PG911_04085 [Tenacibaculum ovolyticum]|uniref:hypothetical protein n=1 Tax=Tenacibaculum ovolyticum TaxID=104270 RepID=UPI0022F393A2|nr:hypothetical protein [Tenacibaculum ovolyticum]WBX77453.1 hypothetical protein PG911_04085 [Tenacibaculum ovolyticum]